MDRFGESDSHVHYGVEIVARCDRCDGEPKIPAKLMDVEWMNDPFEGIGYIPVEEAGRQ